jgi:hypothetical protein
MSKVTVAEPSLVSCCLVLGVAPVVAPVLGVSMVVHFGWQAIFYSSPSLQGFALSNVTLFLGESLPWSRTTKDVACGADSRSHIGRGSPDHSNDPYWWFWRRSVSAFHLHRIMGLDFPTATAITMAPYRKTSGVRQHGLGVMSGNRRDVGEHPT